jgi:GntR family transcriptional repressor for pyruvate dehydrogenase complex
MRTKRPTRSRFGHKQHESLLSAIGTGETVSEAIARQLMQLIMEGKYKAGDRLPSEPELCNLFRVGRGAVREALKALAVTGLVRVERGRGTFVGKRSEFFVSPLRLGLRAAPEIRSLVEARQLIEVQLAALAAERAGPQDLRTMHSCLDRMEKCQTSAEADPFLEADVDFHFALAQAAGNPILTQCMTLIRSLLHEWMAVTWSRLGVTKNSLGEHRAIIKAIERGNANAARKTMLSHLLASQQRLLSAKEVNERHQMQAVR